MQNNKIYYISQDELNCLLLLYYNALYGLDNYKGLKYMQCFKFKQGVNDLRKKLTYININDFIRVGDNNEH